MYPGFETGQASERSGEGVTNPHSAANSHCRIPQEMKRLHRACWYYFLSINIGDHDEK
jgi:hypothetical protein